MTIMSDYEDDEPLPPGINYEDDIHPPGWAPSPPQASNDENSQYSLSDSISEPDSDGPPGAWDDDLPPGVDEPKPPPPPPPPPPPVPPPIFIPDSSLMDSLHAAQVKTEFVEIMIQQRLPREAYEALAASPHPNLLFRELVKRDLMPRPSDTALEDLPPLEILDDNEGSIYPDGLYSFVKHLLPYCDDDITTLSRVPPDAILLSDLATQIFGAKREIPKPVIRIPSPVEPAPPERQPSPPPPPSPPKPEPEAKSRVKQLLELKRAELAKRKAGQQPSINFSQFMNRRNLLRREEKESNTQSPDSFRPDESSQESLSSTPRTNTAEDESASPDVSKFRRRSPTPPRGKVRHRRSPSSSDESRQDSRRSKLVPIGSIVDVKESETKELKEEAANPFTMRLSPTKGRKESLRKLSFGMEEENEDEFVSGEAEERKKRQIEEENRRLQEEERKKEREERKKVEENCKRTEDERRRSEQGRKKRIEDAVPSKERGLVKTERTPEVPVKTESTAEVKTEPKVEVPESSAADPVAATPEGKLLYEQFLKAKAEFEKFQEQQKRMQDAAKLEAAKVEVKDEASSSKKEAKKDKKKRKKEAKKKLKAEKKAKKKQKSEEKKKPKDKQSREVARDEKKDDRREEPSTSQTFDDHEVEFITDRTFKRHLRFPIKGIRTTATEPPLKFSANLRHFADFVGMIDKERPVESIVSMHEQHFEDMDNEFMDGVMEEEMGEKHVFSSNLIQIPTVDQPQPSQVSREPYNGNLLEVPIVCAAESTSSGNSPQTAMLSSQPVRQSDEQDSPESTTGPPKPCISKTRRSAPGKSVSFFDGTVPEKDPMALSPPPPSLALMAERRRNRQRISLLPMAVSVGQNRSDSPPPPPPPPGDPSVLYTVDPINKQLFEILDPGNGVAITPGGGALRGPDAQKYIYGQVIHTNDMVLVENFLHFVYKFPYLIENGVE